MSNREGTAIIAGFVFLFVYAVGSRYAQQDINAAILAGFIAVSIFIVGDHLDKRSKNKRHRRIKDLSWQSSPREENISTLQNSPVERAEVKGTDSITTEQMNAIRFELRMRGKEIPDLSSMTSREASEMLRKMMNI